MTCSSGSRVQRATFCSQVLGRCISASNTDRTAPALTLNTALTPQIGRVGTRLELSFQTTKPLGLPPSATLLTAGGLARAFDLEDPGSFFLPVFRLGHTVCVR